jgi:hypothetical protein
VIPKVKWVNQCTMMGLFCASVLEITQRRVKMQGPDYHPAFTSYLHVLNPRAQRFKTTISLSKCLNTKLRKRKITRPWIQMLCTPAPKINSNVVRYARINSYFLSNEHLWDVLGTDKIWKTQIDMTLLICRSGTTCMNCYLNAPAQLAEIVYPLPQIPAAVFHVCAHIGTTWKPETIKMPTHVP